MASTTRYAPVNIDYEQNTPSDNEYDYNPRTKRSDRDSLAALSVATTHADNVWRFFMPNLIDDKLHDEEVETKVKASHFYTMILYGAFAITVGILFSRIPGLGKHAVLNSWFTQVNPTGSLFGQTFDVVPHFFDRGFPPIVFAILTPSVMCVYHFYAGWYKPCYSSECCKNSENHWKWVAQGAADSFWGLMLMAYFGQRDLAFMLILVAAICGCALAGYGFEKQICWAINKCENRATKQCPTVSDDHHVRVFGQGVLVLFAIIFSTFMAQIFLNQQFVPQWLLILGVFACIWKLVGIVMFVKLYWDLKKFNPLYRRVYSQGEWNFTILNFVTYAAEISVILAYSAQYADMSPPV